MYTMSIGKWDVKNVCELWILDQRRKYIMISSWSWYMSIKNGLLLWRDSTLNVFVAIGIRNLCCEDMNCETDKMFVRLDIMGLSNFMLCCVWPSTCMVGNLRESLCNVYPPISIWLCDRARISLSIYSATSPYRCVYAVLYCMDFWCAWKKSWIFGYVQVQQDKYICQS